jgi:hypothetical protein
VQPRQPLHFLYVLAVEVGIIVVVPAARMDDEVEGRAIEVGGERVVAHLGVGRGNKRTQAADIKHAIRLARAL